MFEYFQNHPIIFTSLIVAPVVAWFVMIIQALFHDAKIAIVGIFASAVLILNMGHPSAWSLYIFWFAIAVKLLFVVLLGYKCYRKAFFYVPVAVITLSALILLYFRISLGFGAVGGA